MGWHLSRRMGEKGRRSLIFARGILIGFYLRDDYAEILRSTVAADGGRTFSREKGEASLTRTPNGGTLFVVHEHGKPQVFLRSAKGNSQVGCRPVTMIASCPGISIVREMPEVDAVMRASRELDPENETVG